MQHRKHFLYLRVAKEDEKYERTLEEIAGLATAFFPEPFTGLYIKTELEKYSSYGVHVAYDIDAERLSGANIWHQDESSEDRVYDWFHLVREDYRSRGIGSKLMDLAIAEAREQGYKKLVLQTYDGFHSMIRFCRRKGFVRIKVTKPDIWGSNRYSITYQISLVNANNRIIPFPKPKIKVSETSRDSNIFFVIPSYLRWG